MRYRAGSRLVMMGEDMASSLIFARRMCSPSLYLPAFMSRNSCSDSSAGRLRKGELTPTAPKLPRFFAMSSALSVDIGLAGLDQVLGHFVQLAEIVAGVVQVFLAAL